MKNSSFDFIKYSETPLKSGDFNGEDSSLSLKEQIDYLKEYKKTFLSFSKRDFNKKIINDLEIKSFLKKIKPESNTFRNRTYIKKGNVILKDLNEYLYLHTYGNKIEIKDNVIYLNDVSLYPAPSFDLFTPFDVKEYNFELSIDPVFITSLRCDVDTMVGGKYIELRNGINEVSRIQFYSNGDVYLRILEPNDIYHHKNIFITSLDYHKLISLNIIYEKEHYSLFINDSKIVIPSKEKINYLLLSCGQYPNGSMNVKFNQVIDFNNNKINIFTLNQPKDVINLGMKALPVAVGGFQNANKSISFVSTFNIKTQKDIFLHLSSINPSGKAFINNHLVYESPSFLSQNIDISNFIKDGDNKLEIVCDPRSPENIITWHRNKDPYFASFIDEIYIEERNSIYIDSVNMFTESINPITSLIKLIVKSDTNEKVNLKISINDDIFLLKEYILKNGINNIHINQIFNDLKVWDNEHPNLYDIKFSLIKDNSIIDEYIIKYGFRTIKQIDGKFLFNDKDFVMKGALLMQYLPKYEDIVINHVCPSDYLILIELMMAKKMNSNTVRMHSLGYGNNEIRYARIADYLGINLIWTTSYIDSLGSVIFNKEWKQKDYYLASILDVINNPSVIAYEGLNEMPLNVKDISLMYKEFVKAIKSVDESRLLFPISHSYYGGDSYQKGRTCGYIQDDGKHDESFKEINIDKEWNDSLVVRSAHTYNWLLGYGTSWKHLRKQDWSGQSYLLNSKNHAYVVSEFAIIGRMNSSKNKKDDFINKNSYEYPDEFSLGYDFSSDYTLSQTYQLLGAKYDCIKMLSLGVDGLLWCSLNSGANDGSYLKPIIDFNLYPKYAFEGLKECYSNLFIADNTTDVIWDKNHIFRPTLFGLPDFKKHDVKIIVKDINNKVIKKKLYSKICFDERNKEIDHFNLDLNKGGYYKIVYKYN